MAETAPTPRQIMDPNGTLPKVELVPDPSVRAGKSATAILDDLLIMHEGNQVGHAGYHASKTSREAWFHGVSVDTPGQGFGLAAYLAAIERAHGDGHTFRTENFTQTESAAKVWARFIDAGIAQVIEPFTPITEGDNAGKFRGHVEIPPPAAG